MIETIETGSPKVVGVKLCGKLHDEDYKRFVPMIESILTAEGKVRLFVQFEEFQGWDMHAAWDQPVPERELLATTGGVFLGDIATNEQREFPGIWGGCRSDDDSLALRSRGMPLSPLSGHSLLGDHLNGSQIVR